VNVPVYWLSFHEGIDSRGPWDTGLLERLFAHHFGADGYEYEHRVTSLIEPGPLGVVVLPARHHASVEDVIRLNAEMAKLDAVLLIISGDEEGIFPWRDVDHDRIRFWVMMPKPGVHDDMADWAWFFGTGCKPGTAGQLQAGHPADVLRLKDTAWFFAGQVTHPRRKQAVNAMRRLDKRVPGRLLETEGFTRGFARSDYLEFLLGAKVAPCPSGPKTVDSMRFYEALEAGCCPLVDGVTPNGEDRWWRLYWNGATSSPSRRSPTGTPTSATSRRRSTCSPRGTPNGWPGGRPRRSATPAACAMTSTPSTSTRLPAGRS
jgi:hypothetical protein